MLRRLVSAVPRAGAAAPARAFSAAAGGAGGDGFGITLSADDKALQELARTFAREKMVPVAAKHDKEGTYAHDVFKQAWEAGLVNIHIPEQYGGVGASHLAGCVLTEELAWGDAGMATSFEINTVAQLPLLIAGTEEQKKDYLGRMTAEPLHASYAVTEPAAGSDVAGIQTRAVKKGDEWVLNGSKMWITNAGVANWAFVLARTGAPGEGPGTAFTGFIVDMNSPGVSVGPKEDMMGQRSSDTRGITFDDVRVPAKNVVGAPGQGFRIAMKAFDFSRPPVAAVALGIARRAVDESAAYVAQRKAFGKPLAAQQAVAFKIADMATGIEASRLLVWKSAWLLDAGLPNSGAASMAKLFASEHVQRAVADCVQVHGGIGFSNACIASKLYRDARILTIYEGASDVQRLIISRDLFAAAGYGRMA